MKTAEYFRDELVIELVKYREAMHQLNTKDAALAAAVAAKIVECGNDVEALTNLESILPINATATVDVRNAMIAKEGAQP